MNLQAARSIMAVRGWLPLTPEPFRQSILERSILRRFERGEAVFFPGDATSALWGLVSGGTSVILMPATNAVVVGHPMVPGQWFGAGPLLLGGNRRIELHVNRRSHLMALPMEAFRQIAVTDPMAWRWLAMVPAMNGLLALMTVEDLTIRDSSLRTAASLLRLANCRGPYATDEPMSITLTQDALANIVNLSRTVLGEILRDFERQGLVERCYSRILVNRKALENLLDIATKFDNGHH